MRPREFSKYLARDLHCPCGCVGKEETFVPQHRIGRGMGGSKKLDHPANILVLCSHWNGLIESSAAHQRLAKRYGWKLYRNENPRRVPFYDAHTDSWWRVDDRFGRFPAPAPVEVVA